MYTLYDDEKRKETREREKLKNMYLNKNPEVRKKLAYEIQKYNKRVDNIERRLRKTGQVGATPQRLDINELVKLVENKHQVNSLINHINKVRVSALGKKTDDGYENVIVGKKGAMILKVEEERLKRDIQRINRKRMEERKRLEKMGYSPDGFELTKLQYNLDELQQRSLRHKFKKTFEKGFITDIGKTAIQQRRENLIDAGYTVHSLDGRLLELLVNELSDEELDVFLREEGSKISFDFYYGDTTQKEHMEKILYYYSLYFGEEKFNELMDKFGREEYKNIKAPSTITEKMEKQHIEYMHKKLGY